MAEVAYASEPREDTAGAKKWPEWELTPPPEGDAGVANWVWRRFQYMRAYRDKLELPALWLRCHELYRNKIFKKRAPYSLVPINLIFKTVNTLKSNLTDNKPRASFMPQGETPPEAANAIQARYDYWWDHTRQQGVLQDSVGVSELYGFAVDKMTWDQDTNSGEGEVVTNRCDPFGIFLWPRTMDIQDGPIAHAEAMELGEIFDRWPEAEGKIKPDLVYSDMLGESRATNRASKTRDLRPVGGFNDFYQSGEVDGKDQRGFELGQRALVIEFWCEDYTMEWIDPRTGKRVKKSQELLQPLVHPETGEPLIDEATAAPYMELAIDPETGEPLQPVEQSKYPGFIRCITIASSGKLKVPYLLDDKPNPSINPVLPRAIATKSYLFDKKPFIKRLSYSDGLSEYGMTIVEQIEPLVMEISRKISQIAMHLHNQAISPLILPLDSGVKYDDVNNLPKRVWKPTTAATSQGIRFLQVPAISSDYLAYIELLMRLLEAITGLTEVSEGRRPTGITAAHAIAALQEKAQTVFREKIRNLDLYLEEQGRMFRSLDQNWHTAPLLLNYQGGGDQEELINYIGIEFQDEVAFHVEAGSTMPSNRAAQRQEMVELAKVGMIDQQALLEELKVPKHDEIIQRMKAGPIGQALEKIAKTGLIDDQTIQTIKNILDMDPKTYKRNFPETGNPLDLAGKQ